jgi:LuxR family transcriptional regulator, maltose regulon positive regulatory protein
MAGGRSGMNVPIIPAKLSPPVPSASYVPRPRLDDCWKSWSARRLIQVTAGAGYGKTALIAANAATDGRHCIWYTFDDLDNDLACFHAHMVEAGRRLGRHPLPEGITGSPGEGTRILSHILLALQDKKKRALFVFDDVQRVAGSPEVLRLLEQLIRFLPTGSTVVLSAREPTSVHVSKIRAGGEVAVLEAQDLCFTEAEVARFFAVRFPGAPLDRRTIRRVTVKTEGWAAGIEMATQLATDPSPQALDHALTRLGSTQAGWFAYFAEEVIARLEPALRDFLLRVAVLTHLDAKLCDEFLGRNDSRRMLAVLHRRNLFIHPVGQGGDVYRLHDLFRQFLQEQLFSTLKPGEQRELLRRAADALAQSGAWAEAAATYARAGDPEATLDLIEKRGEELLAAGRYHVLEQAFETLPAAALARRIPARMLYGQLQEIRGQWEDAWTTYTAARRACPPGEQRTQLTSLVARFQMRRGEYAAARSLCRRALAEKGTRRPGLRAQLHTTLGISAAELGHLDEAEKHFERSLAICRRSGDVGGQGRATYLLAVNVLLQRGEFRLARDAAERAWQQFKRLGDRRLTCLTHGVLAYVTALAGNEREARQLAEEGLRQSEALGYRMIEGYSHCTLGHCALLRRDLSSAREHFETARRLGEELGEVDLIIQPRLGEAGIALAEGNPRAAEKLAREVLATTIRIKDRFQEAQARVLLGIARPSASAAAWTRAEKICRQIGAAFELHRVLLLRLHAARDIRGPLRRALAELLAGSAGAQHDALFLTIEPAKSASVLAEALRLGVEASYAARLLVQLGAPAVPALQVLVEDSSEDVRARVTDVLSQIGGPEAREALGRMAQSTTRAGRAARRAIEELQEPCAPPLQIRALGPFTLEVGGHALTHGDWRSKRALRLFLLLLTHRFRWVPRDVIMESLWPDADPAKADNNLRQTVHILRRILEPELKETRDSRYIRLRNEAWRLDPCGRHVCDVQRFEATLREAETLRDDGRPRRAAERYRQALDLYRGDFLEEARYEDFTEGEREHLRDLYLRGAVELLKLHTAARRWDVIIPLARRALQHDPYREEFHWQLVHALLRAGCRREALDAYMEYERELIRELGVLPSIAMRRLADELPRLGGRITGPQVAARPAEAPS